MLMHGLFFLKEQTLFHHWIILWSRRLTCCFSNLSSRLNVHNVVTLRVEILMVCTLSLLDRLLKQQVSLRDQRIIQ